MSVVIRGMRMPKSCSECSFCGYYGKGDHVCDITGKEVVYELSLEKRLDDCPIVELPAGHGRLIDADALNDMINRSYTMTDRVDVHNGYAICQEMIKQLPTIIEAERRE